MADSFCIKFEAIADSAVFYLMNNIVDAMIECPGDKTRGSDRFDPRCREYVAESRRDAARKRAFNVNLLPVIAETNA